jgi:para-nitrobenzyl esterase
VSISTSAGALTVVRADQGTSARGIRYATADRFSDAIMVDPAPGQRTATQSGPICPQIPSALDRLLSLSAQEMSEDCLFLDVHTPGIDDAGRPVIVWIHGGAFVTGTGSLPWYDGANLARSGDVVVVSINYRLGAFGFTGTADVGLRDQLVALEWVQRHIASFGGDPSRVTVLGESAGGASVIALMAAEDSAPLFDRAWAMSPSLPQIRTAERAQSAYAELLDAAGCEEHDGLLGLSALDTDALLGAQGILLGHRSTALTAFAPTIPGEVVSDLARAHHDPRPLVVGTTRDEMQLFTAFDKAYASMGADDARKRIGHRFDNPDAVIDTYRRHRPGATIGQLVSAFQTDEMFRSPMRDLVSARSEAHTRSWTYWFTKSTPVFGGLLGSCHGLDIPYIFNNLDQQGVEMFTGNEPGREELAAQMSSDLITFACTGEAPWAPYHPELRTTRVYGDTIADIDDPEPDLRTLWECAAS